MTTAGGTRLVADAESVAWVDALRGSGPAYDDGVRRLHALLLRAARHEVARRRGLLPRLDASDVDEVAQQCADDATVAVLAKLATYRGESRFTTWAYKFAILQTAVTLRRRAWQDREIPTDMARWQQVVDRGLAPAQAAEAAEVAGVLRAAITRLSPHQREVLVALVLDGVPIDVLAQRLATTRGALYKTLHDARRRLRAEVTAAGYGLDAAGGAR